MASINTFRTGFRFNKMLLNHIPNITPTHWNLKTCQLVSERQCKRNYTFSTQHCDSLSLRQTIYERTRLVFYGHLNFLFFTTVYQNTVIVAFSVDFHSQVFSQVPNPKHSFHLICIITTAVASEHLPLQLFFHVYVNLRRQEIHSSSSNSNFILFSKVLQHNTLTSVGILKLYMLQQQQQTLHLPWGQMLKAVQGRIYSRKKK